MSMELISREAVLELIEHSNIYSVNLMKNIVSDMPTVKAIPIERLEQIRAEIESRLQGVNIALDVLAKDHALIPRMEAAKTTLEEVLEIIDKAIKEVEQ